MKQLYLVIIFGFLQITLADEKCAGELCSSQSDCTGPNQYCTQCQSEFSKKTCECRPGYSGTDCSVQGCRPACPDEQICTPPFRTDRTPKQPYRCLCPMGTCGDNCDETSHVELAKAGSGYYFELPCDHGNQAEAKNFCESRGGWLAEPRSQALEDIIKTISESKYIYGGLEKNGRGVWTWRDDTSPSPAKWNENDVAGGEGGCMTFGTRIEWYDWECGRPEYFLCQYDSCSAPADCNKNQTCTASSKNTTLKYCKCKTGYYGVGCSDTYCDVHSDTCENGGTCMSTSTQPFYKCDCTAGHYGDTCKNTYCDIHSDTCENGGTCMSTFTQPFYECTCTAGYYGQTCTKTYCEYHSNPCQNEGICTSHQVGPPYYKCHCVVGYCGVNCSDSREMIENGTALGYYFESTCEELNQSNAEIACHDRGGWLAEPKSSNISDAIDKIVNKYPFYYSGLKKKAGNWKWKDGEGIEAFSNWRTEKDEPGGSTGGVGDCMAFGNSMKWFDWECNRVANFLCQFKFCDKFPGTCQNSGTCVDDFEHSPYYNCTCAAGYFGQQCESEKIQIRSPTNVTGVDGESLEIGLVITSYDGNVKVHVSKDNVTTTLEDTITNGTLKYKIESIELASEGTYTFSAYPEDGGYSFNTTTLVIVHVRAFIIEIYPTFIYSPISNSPAFVNCTGGGIPSPHFVRWFKNGTAIESTDGGVTQTKGETSVLLQVENAHPDDSGQYVCVVKNKVAGEANYSTSKRNITLVVYGAPEQLEAVASNCSAVGNVQIKWKPDKRTMDINHKFHLSPRDGMSNITFSASASAGEYVTFDGLETSTEYKVYVEVCPKYGCIQGLHKTQNVTTGTGLPPLVASVNLTQSQNEFCDVAWKELVEDSPGGQIIDYKVTWIETLNEPVTVAYEGVTSNNTIGNNTFQHRIHTKPNRRYHVSVAARNCAGVGQMVQAKGNCSSIKDAPGSVPSPTVLEPQDGDPQGTRDVNIRMVSDESNGTISCFFVILFKCEDFNVSFIPRNTEDLKILSNSTNSTPPAGGYVAVAIKRSTIRDYVTETLGDQRNTECDILKTTSNQSRYRRDIQDNLIRGRNAPLDSSGTNYTMLTVTTTPINENDVKLQHSTAVVFVQGKKAGGPNTLDPPSVVLPIVIGIAAVAVIAFVVGALLYRKRRNAKFKNEDRSEVINRAFMGSESIETEGLTNTGISLPDLKKTYLSMSANECAGLKDQYTDLRQTAKRNAPAAKFASTDDAMRKNRFKNILPYDSTRVHLNGKGMETYINASYVEGTGKSFIAAQGPLSNTIEDFWRMIVEKRCHIIVMLTKCKEQGRIKCEKYWPNINTRVTFGDYEIANLGEVKSGGIIKRNLQVVTPTKDEMTVDHFHFVRWPDHGVPSTTSTFLRLHGMVMAQHKATGQNDPILVHCSAGVGRTGSFIGFDNVITESDHQVDIYSCVLKMRQQRVDMVQTCAQYQLLHKLMLETYLFSDSDFDEADLPGIIADKRWEIEFEQLKEAESIASYGLEHGRGTRIAIVRQAEDTEWVTLNASFMEAYCEAINFIASEGPAPSTIEYFLRAIWDNDVNVIVMLNNPDEESKAADKQYSTYWPQTINVPKAYNNVSIELIEEKVALGITERVLRLTSKEKKTRDVRQLHLTEWTTELQKENRDDVLELINRLQSMQVGDTVNVLVHCTDGLGRTGVFIAVANIIERLQAENRIDVFRVVKDLRDIRPGMVKTLAHYKLCYDLASYFNSQRNPYVNKPQQKTEVKADPLYENL